MQDYSRLLIFDREIEHFVDSILGIHDIGKKREAINLIAAAERNMQEYYSVQTLSHKDNRDFEYRDDKKREELREQIINELISQTRLVDDDAISLGIGGAAPTTKIINEKKAFYIIGPPAAGKSGVSNVIADAVGAYLLDSDYAKRKLPEYINQISGASLVHEESDELVFSYKGRSVLDYCIEKEYNIVIPKIGSSIDSIYRFCNIIKKIGYTLFLISVDLDRAKATQRAYNRFKEKKRYVPLSLVFDGYGNDPTLNYFKIKQRNKLFDGFAQISTDVNIGEKGILLEECNLGFLHSLFKEHSCIETK